jgi:hypothetical protein
MPGMAEPDIAIDIGNSAPSTAEVLDNHATLFAPRARLAGRTARVIGLDATATAGAAFLCFAIFNPARELTSSPVVIPMACLTVSLILSFSERGLYHPPEIVSRSLPWRKVALAWLQAVAIGTLATVCLAALAGHPGFESMGGTLRGPWLPMFLVVGFITLGFIPGPNRSIAPSSSGRKSRLAISCLAFAQTPGAATMWSAW